MQIFLVLGKYKCLNVLAFLPFLGIINTHPKLSRASVHAAANHEAVTWFKDMQGARHSGVSHGTHKDRHVPRQTVQKKRGRITFQSVLCILSSAYRNI